MASHNNNRSTGPYIIGLSGKIGSGKNFFGEKIIPQCMPKNVVPIYLAYADQLKVEVYARDNTNTINYHNLYVEKTKEVRQELQKYGTDIGRAGNKDIWIKAIDMWITVFLERWHHKDLIPLFIITDVRFENEADYIHKKNGILIRINAPKRTHKRILQETGEDNEAYNKINTHKSETALDDYDKYTGIIDNDDCSESMLKQYSYGYLKNMITKFESRLVEDNCKYLAEQKNENNNGLLRFFDVIYNILFIVVYSLTVYSLLFWKS